MIDKLTGKVALITGATAGIGRACARALAKDGARLVLTGRRQDRLEELKQGGNFWDGRVSDLAKQGLQPPINPNEMANIPEGPHTPANGGYSPLLVQKLAKRPYTELFKQVYGQDAFRKYTPRQIYELFGEALAAYQSSSLLAKMRTTW